MARHFNKQHETSLQKTIRTIAQALADHNNTPMTGGDITYATQVVNKYEFGRWVFESKLRARTLPLEKAMPEEISDDEYADFDTGQDRLIRWEPISRD